MRWRIYEGARAMPSIWPTSACRGLGRGYGDVRGRLLLPLLAYRLAQRFEGPTAEGPSQGWPGKLRQLRNDLAAREPVRDDHKVARAFTRRAVGDAHVPVQRVARLGEHCGSVSRGVGRVSVSLQPAANKVFMACSVVAAPSIRVQRAQGPAGLPPVDARAQLLRSDRSRQPTDLANPLTSRRLAK